jgi:exonuclease III
LGTVKVATWNIQDGRNDRLYAAARALAWSNVDVAIVQETKFTAPQIKYATTSHAGYTIRTAPRCEGRPSGGISLL